MMIEPTSSMGQSFSFNVDLYNVIIAQTVLMLITGGFLNPIFVFFLHRQNIVIILLGAPQTDFYWTGSFML